MRIFHLKNGSDTTNKRINGNVKVKQHDSSYSELESKSAVTYRCVPRFSSSEKNVLLFHKGKEMPGFLMLNACLCNIEDDETNI